MENIEEKIFVAKLTQDPYTCDIGGICKGKNCLSGQCEWGITRQKAIDIMAAALINFKYLNTASAEDIEECEKEAEICLNALLKADI